MTFKKEKSHTETTGKKTHFPQDFQLCIISSSQIYYFCQDAYATWL